MRTCAKCGAKLPPQVTRGRPRTKCEACSPKRVRPDRQPLAAVREMPAPRATVPVDDDELSTFTRTRTRLVDAGVMDEPQAAVALRLARRIDAEQDSGTGMKALQQALQAALDAALAARKREGSALDDLRKARERRLGLA